MKERNSTFLYCAADNIISESKSGYCFSPKVTKVNITAGELTFPPFIYSGSFAEFIKVTVTSVRYLYYIQCARINLLAQLCTVKCQVGSERVRDQ